MYSNFKNIKKIIHRIKNRIKARLFKIWIENTEFTTKWYGIKLWYNRNFNPRALEQIYETKPDSSYKLVFEDNFDIPELNTNKWRIGFKWGKLHPDLPWQYFDNSSVHIVNEKLELTTFYRPAFIKHENIIHESLYSIGNIESRRRFKYGIFEIQAIIPKNNLSNPSFWLTGDETWPPEIDIFEFMGKADNKTKSQTVTVHYNNDNTDHGFSAIRIKMPIELITENFNTYTCIWTKDYIKILFNGIPIRKITNKKLLSYLNTQEYALIFGNGFMSHPPENYRKLDKYTIDSVKVWQK